MTELKELNKKAFQDYIDEIKLLDPKSEKYKANEHLLQDYTPYPIKYATLEVYDSGYPFYLRMLLEFTDYPNHFFRIVDYGILIRIINMQFLMTGGFVISPMSVGNRCNYKFNVTKSGNQYLCQLYLNDVNGALIGILNGKADQANITGGGYLNGTADYTTYVRLE